MLDEQEAVNQSAEQPAPVESAPAQTEAPETPSPQTGELVQSEKKVSDHVPYDKFKEVLDERNQLRTMVQQPQSYVAPAPAESMANTMPQLDPESYQAVKAVIHQELENDKATSFAQRHASELADPVLRGTLRSIIEQENAQNRYIDQEIALQQAQSLLNERSQPQVKEAKTEGFEEGSQLARAKEKAGAVGDTSKAAAPVNPDQLSAAEYAQYYNLPRYQG